MLVCGGGSVAHAGHVLDVDRGAADGLDWDVVQVGDRLRAAFGMSTSYSRLPILEVPVGRIRFCALIALTTSSGDRPFDCSAVVFRSTCTWRCLPPYGYGIEAPGTVTSWVRMKFSP